MARGVLPVTAENIVSRLETPGLRTSQRISLPESVTALLSFPWILSGESRSAMVLLVFTSDFDILDDGS